MSLPIKPQRSPSMRDLRREREGSSPEIAVFHDESGTYEKDAWVFTGLLWIRRKDLDDFAEQLRKERGNYEGELHFSEFPKSFEGEYGLKARIARSWFELWRREWLSRTWFHVLAINTRRLKHGNPPVFPQTFHKYNRYVKMAIDTALYEHFKDWNSLHLFVYSDQKDRRPDGDGINKDNFESYIRREFSFRKTKFGGLTVQLRELCCLDSKSNDLLQLTDLLLGAVSNALSTKALRETKLWFGREMAKIMKGSLNPEELLPAFPDDELSPEFDHSSVTNFSIKYFPDENGNLY